MTRLRLLLVSSLAVSLFACRGDDDEPVGDAGSDVPLDAGSDAGSDGDTTSDAGRDVSADVPSDLGTDTRDTSPDVEEIDVFREDTLEPLPDVERPSDWLCDRDARVTACDSELLELAERPEDGDDLLFYVNRAEPLPPEYPISESSIWTPCDGGADPGGHDLVCVPAEYNSGPRRALRQIAWHSPAPPDYTSTHDGRPVGYRGSVGFRAMFEAARAEAGIELFVVSGFRSYETQRSLHEGYVAREMETGLSEEEARYVAATYSARPGHSEHQLGTTADITYRREDGTIFQGLSAAMGASRSFQWVFRNAHRFGIALTYGEHRVEVTQYVYEPWHYRFVGVEAADQMHRCDLNTEEALAQRYGADALPEWGGEPYTIYGDSSLIEHVTLPPGSWVATGATVRKTWRVRNTGSTNWWNYGLLQVEGPSLGADVAEISCIVAGADAELSLDVTMPAEPGLIEAAWAVFDPEGVSLGEELPLLVETSELRPTDRGVQYVRIEDISYAESSTDPGADIDAVVVSGGDGADRYAAQVVRYAPSVSVTSSSSSDTLGAPDAFGAWPDTSTCFVDGGFASLGGTGELIVRFDAPFAAGSQVTVLEVGGCEYAPGSFAITDEIRVSVSSAPEGPWTLIATGTGPAVEGVVP